MSVHNVIARARTAKRHWRKTRRQVQSGDARPVAETNAWRAYEASRDELRQIAGSPKSCDADRALARSELAVLERGNE